MSEEEKKAIETIEELLRSDEPICEDMLKHQEIDAMRKLLNLIEKQQKEIEEIKEEYKNEQLAELKELNNYIRKDKIRKKIKELEDNMILFTNDKEKFNRYKYARDILEKILGE